MTTQPADIANQALDALGNQNAISDLEDGTLEAKVMLRHYSTTLRQLSRAANWNFCRKRVSLILLNDASGQTTQQQINDGGPVTVGPGTVGMRPWLYEYRWPTDCLKVRFVPRDHNGERPPTPNGNLAIPPTPLFTGQTDVQFAREVPTRFLVTNDAIPNLVGVPESWADVPDTSQTIGQGLTSQTVILTNHRHATAVYTALITYVDQWDVLFREAMVAMLAIRGAMSLVPDHKMALSVRAQQVGIAKAALDQARISDGNEGWTSTTQSVDWLRIRNSAGGAFGGRVEEGGGMLWGGWDSVSGLDNSSAY